MVEKSEKTSPQPTTRAPWADVVDERQSKHVDFCLSYVAAFNHGAPGHLDYITIAQLAQLVRSQAALIGYMESKFTVCAECGELEVREDTTREQLAAYAHEAWSGWMAYFLGKSSRDGDPQAGHESDLIVPGGYVQALQALIDTPYAALSKEQKDNDRAEADKMLAILRGL